VTSPVLWQLAFNVARPDLSPAVVRQAIAKVVNRHELVADSIGLVTAFGQTSGNRLFPAGAPGSQGDDGAYGAVDLAEATDLLASAGDVTDADGYVHAANGDRLDLSLLTPAGNATMATIASTIQAELLNVGITVTIRTVPLARMLTTTLPTGAFDMALVPYPVSPYPSTTASLYLDPVGPVPPPDVNPTATAPVATTGPSASSTTSTTTTTTTTTLAPATANGTTGTGGGAALALLTPKRSDPGALSGGTVMRDVLGFTDPTLPGLFAEASTQLNTASELSLYDEIDTTLWEDMPTLPLFQTPIVLVYRVALVGVSQSSSSAEYLWDAENWAVEKNPPPVTTTTLAPSS
jgi:ABC-type transport system substrate-binding protein